MVVERLITDDSTRRLDCMHMYDAASQSSLTIAIHLALLYDVKQVPFLL